MSKQQLTPTEEITDLVGCTSRRGRGRDVHARHHGLVRFGVVFGSVTHAGRMPGTSPARATDAAGLAVIARRVVRDHDRRRRDWPESALALRPGRSGYFGRMACPELPDSARVRIELEISGIEAAAIDEVVAQPEFAGWTRGEWCVEIIRTALRYYVGDPPPDDLGQEIAEGQETAEESVAGQREAPAAQLSNQTAAAGPGGPGPDGLDHPGEAVAAASEPEVNPQPTAEFQSEPTVEPGAPPQCAHPASARDYETGTCAACGAILWD
jgi:hypothetical protein